MRIALVMLALLLLGCADTGVQRAKDRLLSKTYEKSPDGSLPDIDYLWSVNRVDVVVLILAESDDPVVVEAVVKSLEKHPDEDTDHLLRAAEGTIVKKQGLLFVADLYAHLGYKRSLILYLQAFQDIESNHTDSVVTRMKIISMLKSILTSLTGKDFDNAESLSKWLSSNYDVITVSTVGMSPRFIVRDE